MGMFTGSTPAEIADALEALARYPHNTGTPSMLDQATLAYAGKYPAVRGPQLAFTRARHAHMWSYDRETEAYSQVAWDNLMKAARDLAAALRSCSADRHQVRGKHQPYSCGRALAVILRLLRYLTPVRRGKD